MAVKRVDGTTAGKQIRAGFMTKDGKFVGKIQAHIGSTRRVTVNLFDFNGEIQIASAGGYGYDKIAECLNGMTFHELKLTHNWESDLYKAGYEFWWLI
jgi:hypothetical protein